MSTTSQGIVVLDTTCFKALESPDARERFDRNLRIADLAPAISEVNLLEAVAAGPPSVQERLLATIRSIAGSSPLLPWPFRLLRQVGESLLAGDCSVETGATGKEWYLNDLEACRQLREECLEFNHKLEEHFTRFHHDGRRVVQRRQKRAGVKRNLEGVREFLDNEWPASELHQSFASATWTHLGLPGEAPLDRLRSCPPWALLLDVEGLAVYLRGLIYEQPRAVQRNDLIQLIYLGAAGRRILASADNPFLHAAGSVISGRYPGARVMHIKELIA